MMDRARAARVWRRWAAVALLGGCALAAPPAPAPSLVAPGVPELQEEDRLRRVDSGDVLDVVVPRYPEFSKSYTVGRDGAISVDIIGTLNVRGLTASQVEQNLTTRLGEFLRHPQGVSVRVAARRMVVRVLGHVEEPGPKVVAKGANVQEVLALARGAQTGAILDRIVIRRNQNGWIEELPCDLQAYLEGRAPLPELRNGDEVFVPRVALAESVARPVTAADLEARGARQTVQVLGAVKTPGEHPWREGTTWLAVLAGAGGTLESADLAHLRRVPRGSGQAETFDLDGYLQRGGPAPAIEPGDVLVVPTRTVLGPSVRVVGAVVKPGAVQLGRDTDLQQALALAGGPAPGADLRQIRVFAAGAEPGAASVVDLEAILRDADLARLKPLAEGDTVFVPKAREAADPNAAAVTVYVFGAVARPGAYPLKDNRSVLAALAQAGGLLPTADGEQVTITRGPAATGERRARFNFRAYQSGETTPVPTVADGDMVEVPVNEVTLVGQVVRVGPVALRPGATVVEALAAGGGPTKDADLTRISLTRRTPEGPRREMVDLRAYLVPGGNLPALPVVRAGDVIHLEAGVSESLAVLVVGAVARPGPVSVTGEGASILSVLAQAGGAAATADRSAVRVLRPAGDKVQHLTCDLQALLTGKADAPLRVLPGDVVNVEDLGRPGKGVLVLGGVQRQGWVNILTPTQTVMETLGQAGGLTPQGLHAPTHLVRANGEVTTLDLGALSRRGVPTPVVREGDTLIFAQRNPQARSLWDDILRMIPIVSWFWRP